MTQRSIQAIDKPAKITVKVAGGNLLCPKCGEHLNAVVTETHYGTMIWVDEGDDYPQFDSTEDSYGEGQIERLTCSACDWEMDWEQVELNLGEADTVHAPQIIEIGTAENPKPEPPDPFLDELKALALDVASGPVYRDEEESGAYECDGQCPWYQWRQYTCPPECPVLTHS